MVVSNWVNLGWTMAELFNWLLTWLHFTHFCFCAVSNCILQPTGTSRCVRLIVPDNAVKLYDPRLNRSQEIWPKANGGTIFNSIRIGFDQCSFVRHKIGSSNSSKTVWPKITTFYNDIHTDIVYSHTGYDVTIYFRLEVIGEKQSKMRSPTALYEISGELFKLGS